jgi:translation initiation factor 1
MSKRAAPQTALVYSTEHGRMCPACGLPQAKCACGKGQAVSKGDGTVRVGLETKGRKGKGVTVISGLPLLPVELNALAKRLKQRCGSGGTVKEGSIEMQGDHRQVMVAELTGLGYRVKRVGG